MAEFVIIMLGLSFLAWHHFIQSKLVERYEVKQLQKRLEEYVTHQKRQH